MLFSGGAAQDLLVASYADGNEVNDGTSTLNLDVRDVGTFPGAEIAFGNPISATMPISGRSVANTNDSIVPLCFAGTEFAYPVSRGTDVWDVYAPFADASVSIYNGGSATPASTFNVTRGTAVTQTVDVTTVGIVESDVPVLVTYHTTGAGYDSEVLYPATNELYGISSSQGYVTFIEDNTTLEVYASGGGGTTVVQNRGDRYSIGYGASQGTGEAIHLVADKPIVASSQADSDGGESMEFWPAAAECATEYILPGDTQYISGAAIEGETSITVYNPDGSVNTTGTTTGSGFDTYVLVQNPSDEAARVRFIYMTSTGDTLTEEFELPPKSRYTRCLSDVEGLESDAVSPQVESLDGVPIVCERSVYFDFTEFLGGHDSIGYALTD